MNQKVALLRIAQQLTGIALSDMSTAEKNVIEILAQIDVVERFTDSDRVELTDKWERMNDSLMSTANFPILDDAIPTIGKKRTR